MKYPYQRTQLTTVHAREVSICQSGLAEAKYVNEYTISRLLNHKSYNNAIILLRIHYNQTIIIKRNKNIRIMKRI